MALRWPMRRYILTERRSGERPYGYISFRVNLTPYIRFDSENIIAVRVDTEKLGSRLVSRSRYLPQAMSDWSKPTSFIFPNGVYLFLRPKSIANMPPHPVMVESANGKKKRPASSYTIEIFKLDKANIPRERVAVGAEREYQNCSKRHRQ